MKLLRILIIILALTLPCHAAHAGDDMRSSVTESVRFVSSEGLSDVNKLMDFSFDSIIDDVSNGNVPIDAKDFLGKLMRLLFSEIYGNIHILSTLVAISVLCGFLSNLQSSFSGSPVCEISFFAVYALSLGICIKGFGSAVDCAVRVISDTIMFMQGILPSLGVLMFSSGAPVRASAMHGVLFTASELCGIIVKAVIIPIIYFTLTLKLITHLGANVSVSKFAQLGQKSAVWIMGISMTVFVSLLGVTGFASGAVDAVSAKTAKFAIGNAVPFVGGALSDAAEAILGSALLLKRSFGVAAFIFIMLLLALPLIKIGALIILYRLCAAITEPIGDKRISDAVSAMADVLGMLFAATAFTGVLAEISLCAVAV